MRTRWGKEGVVRTGKTSTCCFQRQGKTTKNVFSSSGNQAREKKVGKCQCVSVCVCAWSGGGGQTGRLCSEDRFRTALPP